MINRRLMMMHTGGPEPPGIEPLVFSTSGYGTGYRAIALINNGGNAPVLEYSYDNEEWKRWDYQELPFGGSYGNLYLRGDNDCISYSTTKYSQFDDSFCTNIYKVTGPVDALVGAGKEVKPYTYYKLFAECKKLNRAPELPSEVLNEYCYANMFYNCSSLQYAPELHAEILAAYCYTSMFYNCLNVGEIKCLATDISATGCTSLWLSGTSSSGRFYKNADTTWPSGNSGIPKRWTVYNV